MVNLSVARTHENVNHLERSTSGMMALPAFAKCLDQDVAIPLQTTTSHPEIDSPLHASASPLITPWKWPSEPLPDGSLRVAVDEKDCGSPVSFAELAPSACTHTDGDVEACDDDHHLEL